MQVNILIVEDEKNVNQSIAEFIGELGTPYHLIGSALNGYQALEFFDRHIIDIMMTDIRMPVMDGLELIEKIDARSPDTRVIILSGYNDFQYAQKALKFGAVDYLLKPLKKEELISCLVKSASSLYQDTVSYCSLMVNQEKWDMALIRAESELFDQIETGNSGKVREAAEQLLGAFRNKVGGDPFRMIPFLTDSLIALKKRLSSLENMDTYILPKWDHIKRVMSARSSYQALESAFFDFALFAVELIKDTRKQTSPDVLYHCKTLLEQHYNRDIPLNEMAAIIGVSPSHLCRLFKKQLGINYVDYIHQLRVLKAKELLVNPHLKVMDIANMVGYENSNYFSRVFKKVLGITPQEFREQAERAVRS